MACRERSLALREMDWDSSSPNLEVQAPSRIQMGEWSTHKTSKRPHDVIRSGPNHGPDYQEEKSKRRWQPGTENTRSQDAHRKRGISDVSSYPDDNAGFNGTESTNAEGSMSQRANTVSMRRRLTEQLRLTKTLKNSDEGWCVLLIAW